MPETLTPEINVQALGLLILKAHPRLEGKLEIHYSNQFPLLWRARRQQDGTVKVETSLRVTSPDLQRPLQDLGCACLDLWTRRTSSKMLMARRPDKPEPRPLPRRGRRPAGDRKRKAEVDWLGMEKDIRKTIRDWIAFPVGDPEEIIWAIDHTLLQYTERGPESPQ